MDAKLLEKIRECPSLPTLPAIALRVLELARAEHSDTSEVARIIMKDPALSSKILKTVNSSFYALSQSVGTINHALVILGLQSVKTLVLGFSLVSNLAETRTKGFRHLEYWRRSVYAATAARMIAGKLQLLQQEECFLAALLQDIGMLVLDQVLGEQYGKIHAQVASHQDLCQKEQEVLGTTHAEVSGHMAEQWKLPPLLALPMAWHHRCDEAPVTEPALRKLVEVVSLSGRCADVFVSQDAAGAIRDVRRFCLGKYHISEPECDAMLNDICNRTREVAPMFEISITSISYESILKKANETLVELTLRTQQQAASLEQQNLQLKVAATTDGLTGLANRATFDRFMSEQFVAAAQTGKPLSMLMIDVDKFKSINDARGHQTGDEVLRILGRLLRGAARAQDLAARYGGEEMVLVLPATSRATAAAIAESLRRAIAARPLSTESGEVPVTISIGVATVDKDLPFKHPSQLIKAADMGVYAAKHGGRNCVKVFTVKPQAAAA
ncbi:MAG: HDOD domain-containing protein [Tepidisphaerales bacterium]